MSDPEAGSQPSKLPFLSPAEWQIFSVLSLKGPQTIRQLVAELATITDATRGYTTILTLAQRLAAKGYLAQSEKAASHGPASAITYSPCVSYVEALRRHTERFLAQFALNEPADLLTISEVLDQRLGDR